MTRLLSIMSMHPLLAQGGPNIFSLREYIDTSNFLFCEDFVSLGLSSAILALACLLFILLIGFLVDCNYKRFENFVHRHLLKVFLFVWVLGFIVYDVGMYTGELRSLFGNAPMAAVHAFTIFIFNSDVGEIHDPLHQNWAFMCVFSLVHFFAALVSLAFVLKHFGFIIMAAFKRLIPLASKQQTFVFWGLNDAAYSLAKSINDKKEVAKDSRIIVIRTNEDDEEKQEARTSIEQLLGFLSIKKKELARMKDLDCYTFHTVTKLSAVDMTEKSKDTELVDILKNGLYLNYLCHVIEKKTTEELHFFFLSSNEEENIQAVTNLKKDTTIAAFLSGGNNRKVHLYCHARYNSVHRVIEDEDLSKNLMVRVIDSSHLSVELQKKDGEKHPVNFVKVEKDATVSSTFNSLVVGFGEVGQDMVRFLYEFGAFVKTGSTERCVVRSDFHCRVVDKDMKDLAGVFTVNAPSVDCTLSWANDPKSKESNITLYDLDCGSVDFYKNLEKWITYDLNYVVICTGNDELNISLAVRIIRLTLRYRSNQDNFMILVRVRNDENHHFHNIAEHYNRLWAAEKAKNSPSDVHQKVIRKDNEKKQPIVLFGSEAKTYTFENIVSEELKGEAKTYKEKYDCAIYESSLRAKEKAIEELKAKISKAPDEAVERMIIDLENEEVKKEPSWDEQYQKLMHLTEDYKDYSPTFAGIMKLRRIQSQNFANSLHKNTLQRLADRALGTDGFTQLTKLTREEGQIKYFGPGDTEAESSLTNVLNVLAQTEHLRWTASHQILGYRSQSGYDKDETRLLHGCLKPWQELTTDFQVYDYNVVDVSLGINNNIINH